jgi:hypothetical protein
MAGELTFVLVAEAGDLERKAALLVDSIRTFAGPLRDCPVWVVQPRPGKGLSQEVLDRFARHDVVFVSANLNRTWRDYGLANKVHAAAFVESLVAGKTGALALVDSDMLFLRPPEQLLLDGPEAVAARPVDGVGVGLPSGKPVDDYWRLHFDTCGVDESRLWDLETTVDRHPVRAYFNSGLVSVRPSRGVFQRWRDNLERLAQDERVGRIPPDSPGSFFLEQASLAATVLANVPCAEVKLLDWRYNYPLRRHASLPRETRASFLDELVAVHYHKWFYNLAWTKVIPVREPVRSWLMGRLPLQQCG